MHWQQGMATAAVTVVSGALVYTLGQFLVRLLIEPFHRLREHIR